MNAESSGLMDRFRPGPPDEIENEFALWLQNAALGEQGIATALAERYAAPLYCWLQAVFPTSDTDIIKRALQRTFRQVQNNADTFRGQESLRSWLYGLAFQSARQEQRKRTWEFWRRASSYSPVPDLPDQHETGTVLPDGSNQESLRLLLAGVERLPTQARLAVILRYTTGQSLSEIAAILQRQPGQVHRWLCRARLALLSYSALSALPALSAPHPEFIGLLQMVLDSQPQIDSYNTPDSVKDLETHLEDCPACRAWLSQMNSLEAQLAGALQSRWTSPPLDSNGWQLFIWPQTTQVTELPGDNSYPPLRRLAWVTSSRVRPRLIEFAWVVGTISLVLLLILRWSHNDRYYIRLFP
jgi:RNA polymerase sigma factor (sigma-70 family)